MSGQASPNCPHEDCSGRLHVKNVLRTGPLSKTRLYQCRSCGRHLLSEVVERFITTDFKKRYLDTRKPLQATA